MITADIHDLGYAYLECERGHTKVIGPFTDADEVADWIAGHREGHGVHYVIP